MSTAIVKNDSSVAGLMEQVVIKGDLAKLTSEERLTYYNAVCSSVGLNPLTRPLEYITLDKKLTLYARKDATDQLRKIHDVSVTIVARELVDDCYVVTARATLSNGRTDESIGAVSIGGLKGDAKCNGMMKAETKAKRRVTLSICGLGLLDETEIETIPGAKPASAADVPRIEEDIPLKPTGNGDHVLPPAEDRITAEQAKKLHMRFRESLPEDMQSKADAVLYDWLGRNLYLDAEGNPSAIGIRKEDFAAVGTAAVAFAKEFGK